MKQHNKRQLAADSKLHKRKCNIKQVSQQTTSSVRKKTLFSTIIIICVLYNKMKRILKQYTIVQKVGTLRKIGYICRLLVL